MIFVYFGPFDLWLWCHRDDMDKIEALYDLVCKATPRRSAMMG